MNSMNSKLTKPNQGSAVKPLLQIALTVLSVFGGAVNAEAYNRYAAVDYAWRYVWTPNPAYRQYPNDCTNFVSQCMRAGGWQQIGQTSHTNPSNWFYRGAPLASSYTWTGANYFENFLMISGRGYRIVDQRNLLPGDVIAADWGDGANAPGVADGKADHLMIVLQNSGSDVLYAQHSSNKVRRLNDVRSEFYRAQFRYYRIRD